MTRHPRHPPTDVDVEFPEAFLWGSATASYQIEGAVREDGRTDSIWDAFCRVPGAVEGGHDGDVADDHYHRYRDDVALMRELNLDAYRFSVAWPRVCPDGGPVNPAGLDFYSRLVDELLESGVRPWLTLYHWDLPQTLESAGGWPVRDTAYRFAEYALRVHDALGDRVRDWTTLNEPWCSSFLGYAGGQHAPGRQEPAAGFAAAHHLLLGHGLVADELRRRDPDLSLGITLNLTQADPADPSDAADVDAARRIDGLHNRLFLDPVLNGGYPEDVLQETKSYGWQEVVQDGDLAVLGSPIDFLGVNYYHGNAVSARPQPGSTTPHIPPGPRRPTRSPYVSAEELSFPSRGLPVTAMGWEVQPWGLRDLLVRLSREYQLPPMYVTENGAAYHDVLTASGEVDDRDRLEYVDAHLRSLREAMDAGVDVRGYFVWSLLDNFEWAEGYSKRFGLVHVDFATGRRTPKASYHWYRDRIAAARSVQWQG